MVWMARVAWVPITDSARPTAVRLALVGMVALSLGVLTAYAQEWLPSEVNSLANSSGSWALVAFGLALLSTNVRNAALIGCLSLLGLLAGYKLGAEVRGFATGTSLVAFWGAAAFVVGPVLGVCAHWVKRGRGRLPAVGIGVMSGVLVGEGIYGLRFIDDTTSPVYWCCEILVGVILATWVVLRDRSRPQSAALAAAVGVLTAAAFVAIYSQDIITAFP